MLVMLALFSPQSCTTFSATHMPQSFTWTHNTANRTFYFPFLVISDGNLDCFHSSLVVTYSFQRYCTLLQHMWPLLMQICFLVITYISVLVPHCNSVWQWIYYFYLPPQWPGITVSSSLVGHNSQFIILLLHYTRQQLINTYMGKHVAETLCSK
jgi:hypothetical protein